MKRQDYYPGTLDEQVAWLENFADQLPAYASALKIGRRDLEDAVADARWLVFVLGPWRRAVRTFSTNATATLEQAQTGFSLGALALPSYTPAELPEGAQPRPAAALNRLFALVRQIKKSPGYTADIGATLRLVTIMDGRRHPWPTVRLSIKRVERRRIVVLKVRKWGRPQFVVESRRGEEETWTRLGTGDLPTFKDERPNLNQGQAETRFYRVAYWASSHTAGEFSPETSIEVPA